MTEPASPSREIAARVLAQDCRLQDGPPTTPRTAGPRVTGRAGEEAQGGARQVRGRLPSSEAAAVGTGRSCHLPALRRCWPHTWPCAPSRQECLTSRVGRGFSGHEAGPVHRLHNRRQAEGLRHSEPPAPHAAQSRHLAHLPGAEKAVSNNSKRWWQPMCSPTRNAVCQRHTRERPSALERKF